MRNEFSNAHCLMPATLAEQMPALLQQSPHDGKFNKRKPPYYNVELCEDTIAFVKIFAPTNQWTWFVTEYDPVQRLCFGLVVGDYDEWGEFALSELEEIKLGINLNGIKIPDVLKLERDLHFRPTRLREITLHPGQPRKAYERHRAPEKVEWQEEAVAPGLFVITHPYYLPVVQWRQPRSHPANLMSLHSKRSHRYVYAGPEIVVLEMRVVRSLASKRAWELRCEPPMSSSNQRYRSIEEAKQAAIAQVKAEAVLLEPLAA